MTGVEKRLVSEMLALPLESRAQLMEVLAQSLDEPYNEDFKVFLREIEEIQR